MHLRDKMALKKTHPAIFSEFVKSHFTVQKTMRRFSNMSADQAHEQENGRLKDGQGAIELLQDEKALARCMIAGSELVRRIEEFKNHS